MKCETDEMTKSSGRKELLTVLEGFRNAIWIVPGVTSLVVILFLTMGHTHVSETGRKFLTSLVYSALIGLPSAVLLTWISYRFSCVRTSLQVLMQTTVLVVTGTLGSLAAGIVFQIAGILPREEYWVEFRGSYPFALVITLMVGLIATWIETMRHKLHRQQSQHAQPVCVAAPHGQPAVLGERDARRRVPFRSGCHAGPGIARRR